MAKYHRIKWRDDDLQELKRVVRNYNAKINRLARKDPKNKNVLPDKVSVGQLKELINTRQDLKRELNSLKRFSRRGAEEIVTIPGNDYNLRITKWQQVEMNRRVAIINRRRETRLKLIEETEMTSRGEKLGYTRGDLGMGKLEEVALRPMQAFTRSMGRTDLSEKWKSILAQSQSDYFTKRDYEVKANYLKGIRENYNFMSVKDVYDYIEKLDINEFFQIFNEEGGTFEIASPDGQLDLKHEEYLSYENALRATWLPNKRSE